MVHAASSRRDQRRRLLAAWNREDDSPAAAPSGQPREAAPAAYDEAARPERHPALATRLPTGLGGLTLAALAVLLPMAAAVAVAVAGPVLGRPLPEATGRFAGTITAAVAVAEGRGPLPLYAWLAQLDLLAAAAVAGAVRTMRRHRRDDYRGRFRAWGWLAVAFTVAAWAGALPLGPLFNALLTDATGVAAGPAGIAWWAGCSAFCLLIVVPWAVLPLRERWGTGFWMLIVLAAWAAAAAVPWAAAWIGGPVRGGAIAAACWAIGSAAALVAMLAAARSVIREVRGESPPVADRDVRRSRRDGRSLTESEPPADPDADVESQADSSAESSTGAPTAADDPLDDESWEGGPASQPGRKLSKAERRRLKKLARINGHAA